MTIVRLQVGQVHRRAAAAHRSRARRRRARPHRRPQRRRLPARRGIPAARRRARRLRRSVGHRQARRRRPARGQAHGAGRAHGSSSPTTLAARPLIERLGTDRWTSLPSATHSSLGRARRGGGRHRSTRRSGGAAHSTRSAGRATILGPARAHSNPSNSLTPRSSRTITANDSRLRRRVAQHVEHRGAHHRIDLSELARIRPTPARSGSR